MNQLFSQSDLLTLIPAIVLITVAIAIIAGIKRFKSVKH